MRWRKGTYVRVRCGWEWEGRTGKVLGPSIFVGQWWTPILWDDEEDPNWTKSVSLEKVDKVKEGSNG